MSLEVSSSSPPPLGRKTKIVAFVVIVSLTIGACVTYIISSSYGGSNSAWLIVSRSLLVLCFAIFAILGFTVWRRARTQNHSYGTVRYIVHPVAVTRTRSVKAVEPAIESSFWRKTSQELSGCADDDICSVCLCAIHCQQNFRPASSPPDIGSGQAACCNSWFHRYCVLQYWQSNDGNVICPNCRYERTNAH
jgi:hypothetical protein